MPEVIKFAFVKTDNLNCKSFTVPQAIVEIAVNGAADPLTHQKMRDAVSELFKTTQTAVNNDIEQRDLRIARMGVNERMLKKKIEIESGNNKIQELLANFKKEAQDELTAFKKREEVLEQKVTEANRRENWRGVNWTISMAWTGLKLFLDVGEVVTGPPVAIPLIVKQFVDNLMDLKDLYEDWGKYYASLGDMRKKVREGLTALKNKPKLSKSYVEQFGRDVDLFGDKLMLLESKTKAMSAKVTGLLASAPKKGINTAGQQKAEQTLHNCLTELVAASTEIKKASAYLVILKKNLGLAKANAKSDPTFATVSSWAEIAYKTVNDFKDFVLKPQEWITWIDGSIKFFSNAGNFMTGAN